MLSVSAHRRPVTTNGVPYIDPVSHMRHRSVFGARPSLMLPSMVSSAGCDSRYSSTLLVASVCGGGA